MPTGGPNGSNGGKLPAAHEGPTESESGKDILLPSHIYIFVSREGFLLDKGIKKKHLHSAATSQLREVRAPVSMPTPTPVSMSMRLCVYLSICLDLHPLTHSRTHARTHSLTHPPTPHMIDTTRIPPHIRSVYFQPRTASQAPAHASAEVARGLCYRHYRRPPAVRACACVSVCLCLCVCVNCSY